MQVANKHLRKLYPDKRFISTTPREGELCDSKMKLSWSDKGGWEVRPDARPCEVMRTIKINVIDLF